VQQELVFHRSTTVGSGGRCDRMYNCNLSDGIARLLWSPTGTITRFLHWVMHD
jgi:hypothetical protein